jgi:hypothetical protein
LVVKPCSNEGEEKPCEEGKVSANEKSSSEFEFFFAQCPQLPDKQTQDILVSKFLYY